MRRYGDRHWTTSTSLFNAENSMNMGTFTRIVPLMRKTKNGRASNRGNIKKIMKGFRR